MELRLDIGINQIIGLIKQLPVEQKQIIKKEIDRNMSVKSKVDDGLTELLLTGPLMTDKEYNNYNEIEKEFSSWTKKIFA